MGFCQSFCNSNNLSNVTAHMRCTYDIKELKEVQIINNTDKTYVNKEIESKVKILNGNKKEKLIFKKNLIKRD